MKSIKRVLLALIFIMCFWIMPSLAAEIEDTTLVGGRTTYQIRFADPSVTWNFKTVTFETVAAETYTGTAVTNPSYDVSDTGMTLVTEVANIKYNGNGSFDVFPKQGGTLTVKVTVKDEIFDGAIQDGHEIIAKYTQNFKITINPYLTYDIRYVSSSGKVLSTTTNKEVYNNTKYWTPTEINGYTSPSGKNIVYNNLNKQTIDFTYSLVNYSISYTLDGGSLSGQSTTYNTENSYTLPSLTKTGYVFKGWTGSNGTTAQTSVTIPVGSTGNKSYVANWTPIQYTVVYNANGGSGSMSNTVVSYDSSYTVPSSSYYKTGYTPVGWTTNSNGANDGYGWNFGWSGAWRFVNGQYGITNNKLNLYVRWQINNYSISYTLNGGSISGQKTSYTVNDNFTLPTPIRSGYIFTGWTGTGISSPTMSVTVKAGSTGNRSYTANWRAVCWTASNGTCYMFANSSGTSIDVSSTPSTGTLTNAYYYSTNNGSTWNKVGGKIFYINTSAGSGKDVFYVAATNNGTGSGSLYYANKNWTTSDGTTSFSGGSAIGDGRGNTNSLLNRSYDSNGPALSWLKSVRNNATNGCSDWYLGSPGEISALGPGISYWHSGSHAYTDLGNWSNCGYNSCATYNPFTKAVIPMRSF